MQNKNPTENAFLHGSCNKVTSFVLTLLGLVRSYANKDGTGVTKLKILRFLPHRIQYSPCTYNVLVLEGQASTLYRH
jgi:hypothetical protein